MSQLSRKFCDLFDEQAKEYQRVEIDSSDKDLQLAIARMQGWDVAIETAFRSGEINASEREILRYYTRRMSLQLKYFTEVHKLRKECGYETMLAYINDNFDD